MKLRLLTGEDSLLCPPIKTKKDMYPLPVKQLAQKHWNESTIPEPSVQRRMKKKEKTLKEGEHAEETVPTRWQHLSAAEQYANFKEEYKDRVKEEMEKKAQQEMVKLVRRPDSTDKARRIERLTAVPELFPGKKWYEEQKPSEVKPLVDHTTGLCKVCESTGLNYLTLAKALKRLCVCRTSECPNWTCVCQGDEEEDEGLEDHCSCGCSCDSCLRCKVFLRFMQCTIHTLNIVHCTFQLPFPLRYQTCQSQSMRQ